MSTKVEKSNELKNTATTKKKIQLIRDNDDSDSDSSSTDSPVSQSNKTSSSSLAVTGRHLSSSKKESLETLHKKKLQKQKESSSNIRSSIHKEPSSSQIPPPNPYEDQNRSLALEVDKCRQLIHYKDDRINEMNTMNYELREYSNMLELEIYKLREIIEENNGQIKQLQSHNANLIGALSSAALINGQNETTANANNTSLSINNDEFNLSGDPTEAFKKFITLFPKINAEFSFKITQLNKLACVLFNQQQSSLNNTTNTSRPSLSTSFSNRNSKRNSLNNSCNLVNNENPNNTSLTKQSPKIDDAMPSNLNTNTIKILGKTQSAPLRHIKEFVNENINFNGQENDQEYDDEEENDEEYDNEEEEEVEDNVVNENDVVNEEIVIEEDVIEEIDTDNKKIETSKRQVDANGRLSIIYDVEEENDRNYENEEGEEDEVSSTEEEEFEEALEDIQNDEEEEEENGQEQNSEDDDDDSGDNSEDDQENENEIVTIEDTVYIPEQKSPELNSYDVKGKRRSSLKSVSFHENVIPNTQESPVQNSEKNSTSKPTINKKNYFELENRPVRINYEVEESKSLSVKKRNGKVNKIAITQNIKNNDNGEENKNVLENEVSTSRKSILKPFNPSDINIASEALSEASIPSVSRKSSAGGFRDRRRSKVFSIGGDEPLGPGGSLLLTSSNESEILKQNPNVNNPGKSPIIPENTKNNHIDIDVSPLKNNENNNISVAKELPPKPPKSIFKSKLKQKDSTNDENANLKITFAKEVNNDVKSYLEDICDEAADSDAKTNKSNSTKKNKPISKPPKPPKPVNKDDITKNESTQANTKENNMPKPKLPKPRNNCEAAAKQSKRTIESVYSPITEPTSTNDNSNTNTLKDKTNSQHCNIILLNDESSNDSFKSVNSKGNTSQDNEPKSPPPINQIISNKKIKLTPADVQNSLLLSCEGSARRSKKIVSYKEIPLNVKMRRDKSNQVHIKTLERKIHDEEGD